MQSHPKTPLELLYLDTGSLNMKYIISTWMLIYLKTLVVRDEEELTKIISVRGLRINDYDTGMNNIKSKWKFCTCEIEVILA
jgi:hypothetical protein